MRLSVFYKNENNFFDLPDDSKLNYLNKEIENRFGVKIENQKLIWKGKVLKNSSEPLSEGMKIMLIIQEHTKKKNPFETLFSQQKRNLNPRKQITKKTNEEKDKKPIIKEPSHFLITNKGLPEGFIPTSSKIQETMPSKVLYVRNSKGVRATFAFEDNSIVSVDDEGQIDKIPIPLIANYTSIPIQTHPGYFALGVQFDSKSKWFYFIPNQYKTLILTLLKY